MRQLRLIVVGATIGAICGSVVLGPNHDLRPVGIAVAAGVIVLGLPTRCSGSRADLVRVSHPPTNH